MTAFFFWLQIEDSTFCGGCESLDDPVEGVVTLTGLGASSNLGPATGSIAVYSCNLGFQIKGEATRTCLVHGNWTDSPPTCRSKI